MTAKENPVDATAALIEQNELFGDLIATADPQTPVPTCPGWTLQQLFRHVGRGDRWAAQMVADRMDNVLDPRTVRDGKPPKDDAGALEWSRGGPRMLIDAVAEVGATTPIWTFIGPRPAQWWIRRRLHEATVHRADAALALGVPYHLSHALAADCIDEMLGLMTGGRSGSTIALAADQRLHLVTTDDGAEWTVTSDGAALSLASSQDRADTTVSGRAVDVMLTLVRRTPIDRSSVQVSGNKRVWADWVDRSAF